MGGFQRFKDEADPSTAHWLVVWRRFVVTKSNGSAFRIAFPSHLENSMRHQRNRFIWEALKSSHSVLKPYRILSLSQGYPLMFFQKNISWDLGLCRTLRVSKAISLAFSKVTFHLPPTTSTGHAHWWPAYHIVTPTWASYSASSGSHTRVGWPGNDRDGDAGGGGAGGVEANSTLLRSSGLSPTEHPIGWLQHHMVASIGVIDSLVTQ